MSLSRPAVSRYAKYITPPHPPYPHTLPQDIAGWGGEEGGAFPAGETFAYSGKVAGWKCKKKKNRSKQLFFPSFFPFLFSISSRRPFKPHPSVHSHLAPPPRMSDDVCARATQRLLIFCRNIPAKPAPDWDAEKRKVADP